jgi:CRP-like cAMP-binding protein
MTPPAVDKSALGYPDEVRMLLAMLRLSNLGGLAVAECDNLELRTRLIDYIRRALEADGIYLFNYELSVKDTNLVRSLTELTDHARFKNLELTGKYKSIVIFVHGIEKFNDEQRDKFIRLLNFLRDRLTMIAQPIVIWGTSEFVTELARNAPDFWNWKGHFFSFPALKTALDGQAVTQTDDRHSNLSPIRRYLRRVIEDSDYAVWQELYLPLKAKRATETISPFPPRHTLTKSELRQLAPLLSHAKTYEANQTVFKRGDRGDKCYVIISGEVEVLVPDALGNEMVVSKLGKGDFFGEIALIKRVPRTATIRTAKRSKFVTLLPRSLTQLNEKAPAVLDILTDIAQRRLEARNRDPQDMVSPLRRFAMEGASLIHQVPVDVRDLIAPDRRTVILGDAGAGKTTVLRRLMLDAAKQAEHMLDHSPEPLILPIFIKLNTLTPGKTIEGLILDSLHSYEIYEFTTEADVVGLLNCESPDDTSIHSIMFLLDGLNELPFPDRTRVELSRFIQTYAFHRFVLSCRLQDYTALQGFRTAVLQRLAREDI